MKKVNKLHGVTSFKIKFLPKINLSRVGTKMRARISDHQARFMCYTRVQSRDFPQFLFVAKYFVLETRFSAESFNRSRSRRASINGASSHRSQRHCNKLPFRKFRSRLCAAAMITVIIRAGGSASNRLRVTTSKLPRGRHAWLMLA